MPPRIKSRASKALKENIHSENKLKNAKGNTKTARKPLADKTNSASDDNSVDVPRKIKADVRPRRNKQLPARFEENSVLVSLSNKSKESEVIPKINTGSASKLANTPTVKDTPTKSIELEVSPFKTPSKAETSLVVSRPRRICRLPSRFDDHSISPHKYIPIQPSNASTPIQNKAKPLTNKEISSKESKNVIAKQPSAVPTTRSTRTAVVQKKVNDNIATDIISTAVISTVINKENSSTEAKTLKKAVKIQLSPLQVTNPIKTAVAQKKVKDNVETDKISPDTNNNPKTRSARAKKAQPKPSPPKKLSPKLNIDNSIKKFFNRTQSPQTSPIKISPKPTSTTTNSKKINVNNLSFKVLGGKKNSVASNKNDLDIYEFTFNPEEEPQPQKKKRKKPATKKPPKVTKPKATVTYKSTYDQNISKALSALKKAVKPSKSTAPAKLPEIQEISDELAGISDQNNPVTSNILTNDRANDAALNDTGKTSVHECNYASIRVEDIAADIEPSLDHCDDINYSPVNSPKPQSPIAANPVLDPRQSPGRPTQNNDPLNLQEELSFFDDVPVASSSMNMSVRHPLASPWRVEFGNLPIKWHSNTYVKPNMTPAVESSFVCSEDSNKKKHVYTNMVLEEDEMPQIVSNTPSLKQTSIISFIKEVAERKARKKRGRSVSPSKATPVFKNIDNNIPKEQPSSNVVVEAYSDKNPIQNENTSEEVPASSTDTSNDKENSKEERRTRKRKNEENLCDRPAKSPRKKKDKDCTYFGFDESEDLDQENVSPIKVKENVRGRSLRPRTRPVLQEINGPTRAALPLAAKSKIATSSEAINRVYQEVKSAADAPVFPEKNVEVNVTNVEEPSFNDDSQSVHLFEDIEVVHHLKPTRKSYGKSKKVVTFCTRSASDSDTQEGVAHANDSSYEDDLGDLTFEVPNVKEKKKSKKKPKKLMSKKEEKEAEAWAAGFNSMCEEVEDFPLVVE